MQSSPTAAAVGCSGPTGPAGLLAKVPEFLVKTIDPGDAGPGSAGQAVTVDLCDAAAAEYSPANSKIGDDHFAALKVLAGNAKSGNGDAFVDAFLSGLGADARNGTVTMEDRVVQSFVTPSGEGYAYAAGPTAVIGYVVPAETIAHGLDPAATQESAKSAYTRIIAAVDGKPLSDRFFPGTGPASYPLGHGRYTTPVDPGWVYFKTDDFKDANPMHCGIAPGGTMAGCDLVPSEMAPAGTKQTIVDGSGPARFIHSDTATFTRDTDVLAQGHRIENGPALCRWGYQGVMHCEVGEHSFSMNRENATLE